MIRQPSISIEDLRHLVAINVRTGKLYWKSRPVRFFQDSERNDAESLCRGWNKRWSGKPAFNVVDGRGYLRGRLLGEKFRAHQVAFALHFGRWPTDQIDHINGDRADNRPSNLREATSQENARNTKIRRTNSTGCTGVHLNKKDGLFWATIRSNGRQKLLGRFQTVDAAVEARKAAERIEGYHPHHGRSA